MKRSFLILLLLTCFCLLFLLVGCKKQEELKLNKIEISKVTFSGAETFDPAQMKVEKTWMLEDTKSQKVIFTKKVIGSLEPSTFKPVEENYDTYYIKVVHGDNSIEEWLLWLDKQFSKDGVAENKTNLGRYKLIEKKETAKIGKLLK